LLQHNSGSRRVLKPRPLLAAREHAFASKFGSDISRHPGYRQALIEASIVTNAALAAHSIQQEFGTSDPTGLQAVYGVYLLETRQVWTPRVSEMKGIGLAAAPRDGAGFIKGKRTSLCRSEVAVADIDLDQIARGV
jgi:carbonic anhydrase